HIALDALQPTLAHGTIRARTVEKQPAVAGGLLSRRPDFAAPGVLHPDLVIGILVARNQRAKVLPRDPKDAVADREVAVGVFALAGVAQEHVPLGGVLTAEKDDRLSGPDRGHGSGAQNEQADGVTHVNLRGGAHWARYGEGYRKAGSPDSVSLPLPQA